MLKLNQANNKYTVHVEYRIGIVDYADLPVGQLDVWNITAGSGTAATELIRRRHLKGTGLVRAWVTDSNGKTVAQFCKGKVGSVLDGGSWVTQRY